MRRSPPISLSRRLVPALICVPALVGAVAAQPAMAAHAHGAGPGAASTPVSASSVAATVRRATGYSPSQLNTRAACGAPVATRIRCYARILTLSSSGRAVAPLHAAQAPATPNASSSSSAPAADTATFLQSAYDTTWLSANRGAGDTVAIVDAYGDPGAYGDMQQFRSANGLQQIPTCSSGPQTSCFEVVNQSGQTTNLPTATNDETGSWNVEESLDIDAVSSLCPLCKILMVEANSDDSGTSPDLETAVSEAAALGANQISLSWGSADTPQHASDYTSPYASISSAAILAASGDSAYLGAREVQYPAGLPDVTAVGGTSLSADASAARGYDESAWNFQTCSDGSTCGTGSGCDTGVAKPSYQSGVTTECSGRAYNDLSADADPDTGLAIYDSQPGSEGCGTPDDMCIIGGTSLATPLTAALEAITGMSATPAWTYTYSSLLNDITSGSNGNCSGESIICTAGTGWDGPTGNGSISGDLTTGGPGIGAQPAATAVNSTTAEVSADVDPNDASAAADTSAHWQYGPTTGYGSTTSPVALAAGTAYESASATLALNEPCTYHYRLVATNALGTVYGYDQTIASTLTTTTPVNSSSPTISGGTPVVGVRLTAQPGDWTGGYGCVTSYQWQEAPSPSPSSWTAISGATSATYTPTSEDAGEYLSVVVTEANTAGSGSASSPATAQVAAPAISTTSSPITTRTTPGASGGTTTTTPTASTGTTPTPTPMPTPTATSPSTATPTAAPTPGATSTSTSVRFYRCAHTCTLIGTHGAGTYTPRRPDWGHYLKLVTTLTRTTDGVSSTTASTRWLGPITSATAGDTVIGGGVARIAAGVSVRGSTGRALALARVSRHSASSLTLVVRRTARLPTQTWAYVISRGAVVSATRTRPLNRPVTLRIALKRGQTIRLVAVRT